MVQEALNRWWGPLMQMHGPPSDPARDKDLRWKIKGKHNEELRQEFLSVYVPRIWEIGLTLPDPNLRLDEETGRWHYSEPDWNELKSVVTGHGPMSQERLAFRRLHYADTAWVTGECGVSGWEDGNREQWMMAIRHGSHLAHCLFADPCCSRALMRVYEVFRQERAGRADDTFAGRCWRRRDDLALDYARDIFSRRNEALRLWVVAREYDRRDRRADWLKPPFDRSYRVPAGYNLVAKLRAVKARVAGEARSWSSRRREGGSVSGTTDTAYDGAAVTAEQLDAWAGTPLQELLLTLADDELIIGYWDSEWTGIAPVARRGRRHVQHRAGRDRPRAGLLHAAGGRDAASRPTATPTAASRPTTVAPRCWATRAATGPSPWRAATLYETADAVRLAALEHSTTPELAGLAAKMRREEHYHLAHMQTWFGKLDDRVARGTRAFRRRARTPLAGHARPLRAHPRRRRPAGRRHAAPVDGGAGARWEAAIRPMLEAAGVNLPTTVIAGPPRGGGMHPDFAWLWNEMTMVYRLEPGATW